MSLLTLSRQKSLSYRNPSIDLLCKSMDWFPYDRDLHHERNKLYFEERIKHNCVERPSENIKSVEPTTFPPCRRVLAQHIKRYIAKLYKSALEAYPMNETPIDYDLKLLEGSRWRREWEWNRKLITFRGLVNLVCVLLLHFSTHIFWLIFNSFMTEAVII